MVSVLVSGSDGSSSSFGRVLRCVLGKGIFHHIVPLFSQVVAQKSIYFTNTVSVCTLVKILHSFSFIDVNVVGFFGGIKALMATAQRIFYLAKVD